MGLLCIKDGVIGHKAARGAQCPANSLVLSRDEQNYLKNLVFGDNSHALGANSITVPARQASCRHKRGYISDDLESDSDSVFEAITVFTPEDTYR